MEIGDLLIEAKVQLKHGQYLPWLNNVPLDERVAQKYTLLARSRPLVEAEAKLKYESDSYLTITEALQLIAQRGEPQTRVEYEGHDATPPAQRVEYTVRDVTPPAQRVEYTSHGPHPAYELPKRSYGGPPCEGETQTIAVRLPDHKVTVEEFYDRHGAEVCRNFFLSGHALIGLRRDLEQLTAKDVPWMDIAKLDNEIRSADEAHKLYRNLLVRLKEEASKPKLSVIH